MWYLLQAIILGVIQGVTEFLPISSSGHLVLVGIAFDIQISSFAFDAILNIGTLLALIIYFWNDLSDLALRFYRGERHIVYMLFLTTLPAAVAGYLLQDLIESSTRSIYIVVIMLILVAIAMIYYKRDPSKAIKDVKSKDALVIGLWQSLALIPGTSRSGITILAGVNRGLSTKDAAKYSFLAAIPIIFGAIVKILTTNSNFTVIATNAEAVIIGVIASAISGYIAIKFLLGYVQRHGLKVFGYYRLILAVLIILLLNLGIIS